MKKVPLQVTKQMLFIYGLLEKNRQHGEDPDSGLVGQGSIKRGEPWEGKEGVCMAVRTYG